MEDVAVNCIWLAHIRPTLYLVAVVVVVVVVVVDLLIVTFLRKSCLNHNSCSNLSSDVCNPCSIQASDCFLVSLATRPLLARFLSVQCHPYFTFEFENFFFFQFVAEAAVGVIPELNSGPCLNGFCGKIWKQYTDLRIKKQSDATMTKLCNISIPVITVTEVALSCNGTLIFRPSSEPELIAEPLEQMVDRVKEQSDGWTNEDKKTFTHQ